MNVEICIYAYYYAFYMTQLDYQARTQRAAQICREQGITQSEIANAVGASQSQVSRILQGKGLRNSRLCEEVCLYIERFTGGVSADMVRDNDVLIDALATIWDGTASHAKALSTVIMALASLKNPEIPVHTQKKEL